MTGLLFRRAGQDEQFCKFSSRARYDGFFESFNITVTVGISFLSVSLSPYASDATMMEAQDRATDSRNIVSFTFHGWITLPMMPARMERATQASMNPTCTRAPRAHSFRSSPPLSHADFSFPLASHPSILFLPLPHPCSPAGASLASCPTLSQSVSQSVAQWDATGTASIQS